MGDKEFVVACRGRPFSILTAPKFPVPAFTMIDFNLVRDLKLRMTDLQCAKFFYGGQKLRILGKISTSVQCIMDGAPIGNMHFKAHVVQDMYQIFDTHSIAGKSLSEKLIGPPYHLLTEPTAEPTNKPGPTKQKKKKKKTPSGEQMVSGSSDTNSTCSESPSLPLATPPRSKVQDRWIQHHDYDGRVMVRGWRPERLDRPDELVTYYEDRKTGQAQKDRPVDWDSDGSLHSLTSARSYHASSDEYCDEYTNISSIRWNAPVPESTLPPDSFGPPEARRFPRHQLIERRKFWKEGLPDQMAGRSRIVPVHLQEVPIPHGADYCDPACIFLEEVPVECGYHENFGQIRHCSEKCPGGWCYHTRQMEGRDFGS